MQGEGQGQAFFAIGGQGKESGRPESPFGRGQARPKYVRRNIRLGQPLRPGAVEKGGQGGVVDVFRIVMQAEETGDKTTLDRQLVQNDIRP